MQAKAFNFGVLFLLLFLHVSALADISGKVFRDLNANGSFDSGEPAVVAVTATAYNASGVQAATAVTGADGTYTLAALTTGTPYRVEFTPDTTHSGCNVGSVDDFAALNANVYGSSVQFADDGATVNFALANPAGYNTGAVDTTVFTPIHHNGDPLAGGTSGTQNWFAGYLYNSSGSGAPALTLPGSKIGAVWGVAYSKQAKRVFTSAFIKRHVGLGPMGSGGIYMLEPTSTSFNVTPFFDMDNNSFNTAINPTRTRADSSAPAYGNGSSFTINGSPGTSATYLGNIDPLTGQPSGLGVVGSNAERGLSAATGSESYDPAVFDQVGKLGLGDIDISDNGRYLFVANLYQRKIFRLTLDNPVNPASVTAVSAWDLPAISVTNGVLRPFGLKYHHGKLYIGAVATGENGGSNIINGSTDLQAYVFTVDALDANAVVNSTPVLSYPLNYQKGYSNTQNPYSGQWYPWRNSPVGFGYDSSGKFKLSPTPVLSDIEFTDHDDLIMAFTDRGGHQFGLNNYYFLSSNTTRLNYQSGGDILIAGCQNNVFQLETNGHYTSSEGGVYSANVVTDQNGAYGVGNNQGPGGGEFFFGDDYVYAPRTHEETSQGSVAVLSGRNEVIVGVMNPIIWLSGGIKRLSTVNGYETVAGSGYQLYVTDGNNVVPGNFGKANGLGDVELMTPSSPTEIGNRVWQDTNGNGIQDAGEPGIAGIQVKLLATDSVTVLATAITAADGSYYFSNASGPSASPVSAVYNVSALQPGTAYTLQFPATVTIGGEVYHLTQMAVRSNRLTDSNAYPMTGNAPVTALDIPLDGANNHSFDAGYTLVPLPKTDLFLNKVVSKTTVRHGDTVTYTITVENQSDADAAGIEVQENLPIGLTLVASTPSQGTFANGLWSVGSLNAHRAATLVLTVSVD